MKSTHTPERSPLLSLPREIQQMILLYTYPWLLWLKAYKEIKRWTSQLGSLDEVIADDVKFVDKLCCEELETIWQKITERFLGGIEMRMKELDDTVNVRDHGGL